MKNPNPPGGTVTPVFNVDPPSWLINMIRDPDIPFETVHQAARSNGLYISGYWDNAKEHPVVFILH